MIKEELSQEGIKTELKQVRLKCVMPGLLDRTRVALGIGVNKNFEIDSVALGEHVTVKLEDMNIAKANSLPIEDINE